MAAVTIVNGVKQVIGITKVADTAERSVKENTG
jgi:hypothetical protein